MRVASPDRILTGRERYPRDGRSLDPIWIDDDRVMTLWPSDDSRTRLEFVVWNVSDDGISSIAISDRWPEELRLWCLRLRFGVWDTL